MYIVDELSLWASMCVLESLETALEQDGWKRTEIQTTTYSSCGHTIDSAVSWNVTKAFVVEHFKLS